jgi:hypothetical protein
METLIQIFVISCFGAGVASCLAMTGFWTACAFFGLTPEAKERYWWNPCNGTLNKKNLTERGQWFRRWAIRCFLLFIAFPLCGMIIGAILMVAFDIPLERTTP